MPVWISVVLLSLLLDSGSSQGGRNYRPPASREPPSKEIPGQGVIVGKEIMTYRAKCTAFLAIPFAEPPLGRLRFAPPSTPPKPWSGMRNANKFAPACMQSAEQFRDQDRLLLRLLPEIEFSEDCLYLNIFLPDGTPPVEGWPVMLWFHPGNLSVGATSLWDGSAIAIGQKIIVVTAAYRLNIFGFFTTLDELVPGNAGLLDQVAAMDWVNEKITVFGGNPRNIVLGGHSGGGISIGLHIVSPQSIGKFSKAIIMSARGVIRHSIKSPQQVAQFMSNVAGTFGCEIDTPLLVECLRSQGAQHLLEHTKDFFGDIGPVIDSEYSKNEIGFLPADPIELVADHQHARVPILTGFTDMEDALQLLDSNENAHKGVTWDEYQNAIYESVVSDFENLSTNNSCLEFLGTDHLKDTTIFYYTPRPLTFDTTIFRDRLIALFSEKYYGAGSYLLATAMEQVYMPSFMYRFDYKIKTDNFIRFPKDENHAPLWINAPHQFDLPFAWGMPYWTNLLKNLTWNSADKKMTDTIMILWGNFIKHGNPTHSGINLRWDVFRENTSGVMLLDRNSNMSDVSSFDYKAFEFWNNYYPTTYNVLMQSCNMSNVATNVHYKPSFYGYYVFIANIFVSYANFIK